jgi:hypothetical protein
LVIGLHSLVEFPLWFAGNVFLAGIAAGYLAPAAPAGRGSPVPLVLAAGALAVASAAAWTQYRAVSAIYRIPSNAPDAKRRAIDAASGARLFEGHVDFARLSLAVKSGVQPQELGLHASRLLHFSAEPAVIEALLAALWQQGDQAGFALHERRYCQAFPASYARWRRARAPHLSGASEYLTGMPCR